MSQHPADLPPLDPAPSFLERLGALVEVLVASLAGTLLLAPILIWTGTSQQQMLGDINILVSCLLAEAVFTLLVLMILMKVRGEGWSLLAPRRTVGRDFSSGVLMLPVLIAVVIVSGLFFQYFLPDWVTQENPILNLLRTPRDVLLLILCSILVGGIKEELQRAFVLVRFERYLGGAPLGLAMFSLFFGLGHLAQGADNAIRAALLGLALGLFYLRRRNPTGPIIAHALYDILAVVFSWYFLS